MDLMELYRSVLKTAGVSVDADGYCWRYSDDKSEKLPFVMKKKQVILPYRENLKEPDHENTVFFHPLNQSAARGPSDILDVYRAAVMREINIQVALVFVGMADMVVSTDRHKELTSYELDLITPLKAFDEKLLATLRQVVKAVPTNSNNESYVSAFVKKGGTKDGHKYKFLSKVSWPVFEELLESKSCGGVNLKTKKAEAAFAELFAVLGVTEETQDHYSVGSDSSTAPAFESFLGSVKLLVTRLNEIVDNSPNIFTGIESIPFGWADAVEDIQQFAVEIKKIPMQNGNIGAVAGEEEAPPTRPAEVSRRDEGPDLDEVQRSQKIQNSGISGSHASEEARMTTEERRRASGFNPTPPPGKPASTGSSLAERAEAQKRKIEEQNRRMLEDAQRRRQAREDDDARYYGAERQLGRGRDDYYDDRRDYRRDERRDDRRDYRDDRDYDRRRNYNNPFMDRVEDDERAQRGGDRGGRGMGSSFGQGFSSGRGGRGGRTFGV